MWGAVNILQFIVYYHFIKTNLVAHAHFFLLKLKEIALGEFIPYELITNKVKEKVFKNPNPDFSSSNVLDEMGTSFLFGVCLVLLTVILLLLGLLNKRLNAKVAVLHG